jgi:cytochrome P450 family 9
MFQIFDKSAKKLVKFVEEEMKREEEGDEIELTECFSKFTMDIIASVACGIDSKAFDQKEPSLFERKAKEMQFEFAGLKLLKVIVMLTFPKLGNLLGFSLFSKESQDFFSEAITSSMEHRLRNNEKRDDFIQLMMEAREGKLKLEESELEAFEKDAIVKQGSAGGLLSSSKDDVLDDVGIVANCVQFILGGYDMTQSLLLFCAYALAVNQEVQDKLREEIETVLEENDGEFGYDTVTKMIYLDMVINGIYMA